MTAILEGIRVLDFGRWIAGPYCAHVLASLGADVVRMERLAGEDDRWLMPVTDHGEGAQYLQCNGGKRSLAMDLASPAGREAARRMIARADVVVANYSPKALVHFGLDYPTLKAIKPDIILATATAFGADGPLAERVGFDGVGQAVSGAIYLTGEPGKPYRAATAPIDFSTALSLAYGVLAAIIGKLRHGQGAHVEASLVGTSINIANQILMEEATGFRHRQATGNRSPMSGPSDVFRARDGWFIMQVIGQKAFQRWCKLVQRPELVDDPLYASDDLRGENGAALSAVMQAWCAERSRDECVEILARAGIGCGPVLAPAEVTAGALDLRRTFMREVAFPESRPVPVAPPPARIAPGMIDMARPPLLGEHTHDVLADYGFAEGEIAALARSGAIKI